MDPADSPPTYRVWGDDAVALGPVELPGLVSWVKSKKVGPDTWVFLNQNQTWVKASEIPELKMFFHQSSAPATPAQSKPARGEHQTVAIKPGSLRRIKMFADLEDSQLESFLGYMEIVRIRQFSHVVRKGDHGDAMYLVLEGELRALSMIDGKETTLSTMATGESFGEISLLDHGQRSADIIANQESVLLKISAPAFEKLVRDAPGVAAPFLYALSKSVAARVRHLTKRYEDSIHFARVAGTIH